MESEFIDACENGQLDIVKDLLSKCVDPSDCNNAAICWASHNGHLEVVKLLLYDPRVDPSDCNNYAIRFASINGHYEVVKLLLTDPRVDPSDCNNSAIRWASENGHLEVVKLLKSTIIIRTFHKLNKIVCLERIKKFLLKKVVLRPNSNYIKRLINSF
jgi:ankyrin repeat protein